MALLTFFFYFLLIVAVLTLIVALPYGIFEAIWYYTRAPKFECPSCGRIIRQRNIRPRKQKCYHCKAVLLYDHRNKTWKAIEPVRLTL